MLFEDMDGQLFFLVWAEEDVHLLHSSELLESIFVHGYVSTKSTGCILLVLLNMRYAHNIEI